MQYMDELKVLEDSDRDTCILETGRPPIPSDWVDIEKGGFDQAQLQVGLSGDARAVNCLKTEHLVARTFFSVLFVFRT